MNNGMILAQVIFWIGAYADFDSTRRGLAVGFREGNPLVKYVLDKLPYDSEVELAALKVFVWGLLMVLGAPPWAYIILGLLQGAVALRNYEMIRGRE